MKPQQKEKEEGKGGEKKKTKKKKKKGNKPAPGGPMRIILRSPGPDFDSPASPVVLCSIFCIRSWSLLTSSFRLRMSSNVGAMVCCDYEYNNMSGDCCRRKENDGEELRRQWEKTREGYQLGGGRGLREARRAPGKKRNSRLGVKTGGGGVVVVVVERW